jgi:hypothetical protein
MTRVDRSTNDATNSRQRQTVLGLFPLLLGIQMVAALVFVPIALRGNADFRQYFAGGVMVRSGLRHQLYDVSKQREVEDNITSLHYEQVLPVNHPAYEYLLFAPLSNLTYRTAYLVWMGINVCLLVLCYKLLLPCCDAWLLSALFLGFAPVATVLIHGQDSLLLLLLFVFAINRSDFRSGLLIGLGAFKAHIVLPVLILYVLWRKWRFVRGFFISAGAAAILSVSLVGIRGSLDYVFSVSATKTFRTGVMPNVHGALEIILGNSRIAGLLSLLIAVLTLFFASRMKPSLETALIVLPLTSYYLMLHDLVILLIPIALTLRRSWAAVLQFIVPICGLFPQAAWFAGLPSIGMLWNARIEILRRSELDLGELSIRKDVGRENTT